MTTGRQYLDGDDEGDDATPPSVGESFVFEDGEGRRSRARIVEPPRQVWRYRVLLDDGREVTVVYDEDVFKRVGEEEDGAPA